MNRPILYIGNKNFSSWSLRPWLAMRQAGIAFDEVVIPLDQPDTTSRILAVSPGGRVPALRHGDLVIWESLAICEYAAELRPDAGLWPDDRNERARARAVSCEMHGGFAALRRQLWVDIRRTPAPREVDAEARADIARIQALWTDCRRAARGGDFLFGRFSIADAMFAPVVTRFRSYAIALDGVTAEYAAAIEALPAMQEWIAAARAEPHDMPRYQR